MHCSEGDRNLSRDTHARIYQGELDSSEYGDLEQISQNRKVPIGTIIKGLINAYLGGWDKGKALEVEEFPLEDGKVRFYLWVPYEVCDELDLKVSEKGTYIQKLVRNSLNYLETSPSSSSMQ
ncbi:MAG: hypothetical protein JRJ29_09450 [Deltaproteobacteria bacterium]|nr:hypothetical protein [Deltaproteobacteria bacterium]